MDKVKKDNKDIKDKVDKAINANKPKLEKYPKPPSQSYPFKIEKEIHLDNYYSPEFKKQYFALI